MKVASMTLRLDKTSVPMVVWTLSRWRCVPVVDFLRLAKLAAKKSEHKCFKHVAIALRAGNVVSINVNRNTKHAEFNCLNSIWWDQRPGIILISLRFTKGGQLANALPCYNCLKYIQESGIKKVIYSTANRTLETLRI